MTRKGILVAVTLSFVTFGNLTANDELAITELYGQAVHAYFDGEFEESHKYLTNAIELGTDDPRVYYYRGLALIRLGRDDEAKTDFESGGKLEASGPAQFYPIGRSLERVQGKDRVAIEKVRKQARIAIRLRKKKIEQARIEAFKRDERLRKSGPAVKLGNPSAGSKSDEDPFGTAGNAAPKAATPGNNAAPPAKGDDPFGAPKKAAEPAGDDPFGAPKKAAKPAGDDPFAAPKTQPKVDNDADPFGKPANEPAKDPFAAPKKSSPNKQADPFADPSGKSDEKKSEKKGGSDDPFK